MKSCPRMEEEKNGLGLDEIGAGKGGVQIEKSLLPRGLQFSSVIILGGSKVLIHHTFLKTLTQHPLPPPPSWDLINDRSLNYLSCSARQQFISNSFQS